MPQPSRPRPPRSRRQFGPIDVWVNNAMLSVFSPVKEMRPEEYRRVTEVTYLGYVNGTLAALRRMLPRDRGIVIQVGSALAYRGIPLQSAYCAAKHAIQGFCDSLHSELIHDGSKVRLTMVQMPAMNTPQFGWVKSRLPRKAQPVPPIYQPEVAARAIVWAAAHNRREIYVGWPTVEAIVGNKIAPGWLDAYLARTCYDSPDDRRARRPRPPRQPLGTASRATTAHTEPSIAVPARRAGSSGPIFIATGWPPREQGSRGWPSASGRNGSSPGQPSGPDVHRVAGGGPLPTGGR